MNQPLALIATLATLGQATKITTRDHGYIAKQDDNKLQWHFEQCSERWWASPILTGNEVHALGWWFALANYDDHFEKYTQIDLSKGKTFVANAKYYQWKECNSNGTSSVEFDVPSGLGGNKHNCLSTQNANKMKLDDYYQIYNGNEKYTDGVFSHDKNAFYWKDMGQQMLPQFHNVTWKRISEIVNPGIHSLFGYKGITPEDVKQGNLGNCWFLAAASAIAEKPRRLEQIFISYQGRLSYNGIYAVNFYTLGVPHTVIVDDYLPVVANNNGTWKTLFAVIGDNNFWAPILEKAFAKYHGNYKNIELGKPQNAFRALNGAPCSNWYHNESTLDDLWQKISENDFQDHMISAATFGNDDTQTNESGLVSGHAYTVLSHIELQDANKTRLVQMRNPWGKELYHGDWSDRDGSLWTYKTGIQAGWTKDDDGIFYMSIEDYFEQVRNTEICYDTTDWHHAYYLNLDLGNNDSQGKPGYFDVCGEKCEGHDLILKSSVRQWVSVTAHTWQERGSAESCRTDSEEILHIISRQGAGAMNFTGGSEQLDWFEMDAGEEVSLYAEWNWTDERDAKDWSVTAWGTEGSVTIVNKNGRQSDTMPAI